MIYKVIWNKIWLVFSFDEGMAECRISCMADNNNRDEDNINISIPEGKVEKGLYFFFKQIYHLFNNKYLQCFYSNEY